MNFWDYFWRAIGVIFAGLILWGLFSIGRYFYMADSYDYPTHVQKAIQEQNFDKAHKIIAKWKKYKANGFEKKEIAKMESYKDRALGEEIRLAILNGELNRIEDIASWREGDAERLSQILQSQKMLIFSRLKMIDESTLKALCSYMNTSELMAAYIEAVGGNNNMIFSFISGLSIGQDVATTGAVVGKDILDANMRYMKAVEKYNDACNVALDYAISINDKGLAQKLVLLFKRTLEIQISNDKWFSKDDEYYYIYSDQPIEEAKRKFEMAFKN